MAITQRRENTIATKRWLYRSFAIVLSRYRSFVIVFSRYRSFALSYLEVKQRYIFTYMLLWCSVSAKFQEAKTRWRQIDGVIAPSTSCFRFVATVLSLFRHHVFASSILRVIAPSCYRSFVLSLLRIIAFESSKRRYLSTYTVYIVSYLVRHMGILEQYYII